MDTDNRCLEVSIKRDSSVAYNCCPTHVDVCAGKIPECNCTEILSRAGGTGEKKKKGRNLTGDDEDDDEDEDNEDDDDEDDEDDDDDDGASSDSSKQAELNLEEERRKLVRERILSTGKLSGKPFRVNPSTLP